MAGGSEARLNDVSSAPPHRNRDFLLVLLGQGVSALGDAFSLTALPLLVLAIAGSGKNLGLVMLCYTIPSIAFGPLAGALADRCNRKRLMMWTDFGRAVFTGLIPLAAAGALLRIELVYLCSALLGLLTPLFTASCTAAVPNLVGGRHLNTAMGYLQAVTRIGFVIGPSIAGLMVTVFGAAIALAVDAGTFLFSALTLSALRRKPQPPSTDQQTLAAEIRRGLELVRGTPSLREFMILNVLLTTVTAPGVIALVHHLQIERGQEPWVFGCILSANGLGAIVGYVAAGRVRRTRWRMFFVGGNTCRALANIMFPLLAGSTLYMTAGFIAGFASAFVACLATLFYLQAVPDQFRGRIAGLSGALDAAVYALGVAAGGFGIDIIGSGNIIALIGLLQLSIGALFWLSPRVNWNIGRDKHSSSDLVETV